MEKMFNNTRLALLPILFLLTGIPTKAQRGSGSMYSGFGIGLLHNDNVGKSIAMGGAGVATRSPFFLNMLNPAAGSSISGNYNFMLEAEFKYNLITIATRTQNARINRTDLSTIALWFRLSNRSSITFGTMPISSVNSSFLETAYFEGSVQPYSKLSKNFGDISKVYVNYSLQLLPRISLGSRIFYGFGGITNEESYNLASASSSTADILQVTESTNFSGVGTDLGIQYEILKNNKQTFILGLTSQQPLLFRKKELQKIYVANTGQTLYNKENEPMTAYLHQNIKSGFSYQTSYWTVAADYSITKFPESWKESPSHAEQFNLGLNYFPWKRHLGIPTQLDYSAGVFFDTGEVLFQNIPVKKYGMSLGIGIPLHNLSRINIAYQWQKQGSTSLLSDETSHGISVTFRLADTWFQRPKFQ